MFKNILSSAALIGLFVLVYIDLESIETDIPIFVYGGLFGIIMQAKTHDVLDVIKSWLDAKKR